MTTQELSDHAASVHAALSVVNGGYLVIAHVKCMDNDDETETVTSIFTDLDLALAYIRRVAVQWEGPFDPIAIPTKKRRL